MRVFRSLEALPEFKNAILTIGTFDGVHKGHQHIIQQIKAMAKKLNGETILLTFHPHPRLVVNPDDDSLKLLNTLDEKIELLEHYGIDNLVVVPFTLEFSNTKPEDYVKKFLWEKFKPYSVVIGYDHKFGKDRAGDINVIRKFSEELDFEVVEIKKQQVSDIAVSSTKVRKALSNGEVDLAHQLLGHPYSLRGAVEKGDGIGRKLGYPTANIKVENKNKLIPENGVYIVKIHRNKTDKLYGGLLSIGLRPTINDKKLKTIEAYLFDFDESLYDEVLRVDFYKRIRAEEKFDSLEALTAKMDEDKAHALQYFEKEI